MGEVKDEICERGDRRTSVRRKKLEGGRGKRK